MILIAAAGFICVVAFNVMALKKFSRRNEKKIQQNKKTSHYNLEDFTMMYLKSIADEKIDENEYKRINGAFRKNQKTIEAT